MSEFVFICVSGGLFIFVSECVCMYVCLYACRYVCMYVCENACEFGFKYASAFVVYH